MQLREIKSRVFHAGAQNGMEHANQNADKHQDHVHYVFAARVAGLVVHEVEAENKQNEPA